MKKDLLTEYDLDPSDYASIFEKAHRLKRLMKEGREHATLRGKTLGMIFDKSSTRTRISFEVGMYQLGGIALFLSNRDTQLGRGELIADSARIMFALPQRDHDQDLFTSIGGRVCAISRRYRSSTA